MHKSRRNVRKPAEITRRDAIAASVVAGLVSTGVGPLASVAIANAADPLARQATGVKVGEVTDRSAIVWLRVTAAPLRNNAGVVIKGHIRKGEKKKVPANVAELEGACPGAAGQVRVRYGKRENLTDAVVTPWIDVAEATDFSHQFLLTDLQPSTTYFFSAETAGPGGSPQHSPLAGTFQTAPAADAATDIAFCVVTCLMYADLDHTDGFHIFPAIQKLEPKFVAFTGDNVYYDSEQPRAVTPMLARYHWQRMYSLPRHLEMLRSVATYWEKDDHDTLSDDSWPGRTMGELTFAEGQRIFRQQVPMGERIYRTVRWGRHLQIWLTDGRDFRSPNSLPDGPDKTIWGPEQKAWLKQTLQESDATWKVLISPTPLVGPDRPTKNDNHANPGFAHEGHEIRAWLQAHVPDNFFVICGDRHWQYHSVHPETGVNEFACGPGSDEHAAGTPGLNEKYHRFHRVKGGFLSVTARADEVLFRHHDVHGATVYEFRKTVRA